MLKHQTRRTAWLVAGLLILIGGSSVAADEPDGKALTSQERIALIRRAQVWRPTRIPSMDIKAGPAEPKRFTPDEIVSCDFVEKQMSGRSPKFACVIPPDDEVKVKFGEDNGEVYGEVAATRLLWALGFGADHIYPVRVVCRGCASTLGGRPYANPHERFFDPAAIERKMPGHDLVGHDVEGWKWAELDFVSEADGGAPTAHRDALKLLAALIQHTDSKPEQQRLICLDQGPSKPGCQSPMMMINDLGLTFGRANSMNSNALGSVNFERWSKTPVWKDATGCVANLSGSATGTLKDPSIGEDGRTFLAGLLKQLTDQQLHDLFAAARFDKRARAPHEKLQNAPAASIDEWTAAFKQKRDEIAARQCS